MARIFPHIWIFLLVLIVMGATLFSGGVLNLLDYVFVPNAPFLGYRPMTEWVLYFGNTVLGSSFTSLAFFGVTLLSAGYLGRTFAQAISHLFSYRKTLLFELLGATYFMLNPFMYERMMTQPLIAFGVITFGWGVYFLFRAFFTEDERKNLLTSGVIFGISWAAFPHATYMIGLVYALYAIFRLRTVTTFVSLLMVGGILLLLNLSWLSAPFFGISSNAVANVATFSDANLLAFLSRATPPLGVEMSNLLLYGFWGEGLHLAIPSGISPYWYIFGGIFFFLSLFGILFLFFQKQKKITQMGVILIVMSLVAFVLGLGIATSWSRPIIDWMYEYAPLFRGYREPQKWIGLLMIIEGIGFLITTGWLLDRIRDRFFQMLLSGLLVLGIVLWSPGMLFGFRGQLSTMRYPESFSTVRAELLMSAPESRTLILPWHSYMGCDWTNKRVIANPMASFFSPLSAVSADNIEMGPALYSNSLNPESKIIEDFLSSSGHLIDPVLAQGFTHIFVLRNCANLEEFSWLRDVCQLRDEKPEYFLYDCQR